MKFHGYSEEDEVIFNAAMDAVVRHVLRYELDLEPAEIAERFAVAVFSGERDPEKLKALTLGPEGVIEGLPN